MKFVKGFKETWVFEAFRMKKIAQIVSHSVRVAEPARQPY